MSSKEKKKEKDQFMLLSGESLSLLSGEGFDLLTENGDALSTEASEAINTVLPEPEKKTIMVRQGGHLTEQMLLSEKDKLNRSLLSEYNTQNNATVINETSEIEDIGVKLSPSETRLVTAIRSLLHDKSENKDEKSEQFYMGNHFPEGKVAKVHFGGQTMDIPHLLIKKNELYKAYLGQDSYAGKDKKDIDDLLLKFSRRQFKTVYKQHIEVGGQPQINRITDFLPLLRIKQIDKGLTMKEDELISQGEDIVTGNSEYLLSLNPIWVDQIKTKWVEYPHDLNQRLKKAVDHGNEITPATYTLINYLCHQRSTKNFNTQINEDNLFLKLGLDKYIKRRERKRAEKFLQEAFEICRKIGLLQNVDKATGAQGQTKYIFVINEEMPAIGASYG